MRANVTGRSTPLTITRRCHARTFRTLRLLGWGAGCWAGCPAFMVALSVSAIPDGLAQCGLHLNHDPRSGRRQGSQSCRSFVLPPSFLPPIIGAQCAVASGTAAHFTVPAPVASFTVNGQSAISSFASGSQRTANPALLPGAGFACHRGRKSGPRLIQRNGYSAAGK